MASTLTSGIDWDAPSWDELRRRHRWVIPPRLNVGVEACDRHADGSGRIALRVLGPDPEGPLEEIGFDRLADRSDRLRSALIKLDEVNEGFDRLADAAVVRQMIVFD